VLASTIRLWALADQKEDTSPFLHGFTPPLYIERFSDEEALSLIRQEHLDSHDRPHIPDEVAQAIREHCGNHPYLVQLVCKRYLETGRLIDAIEQVGTDQMVSYFFSVDFDMLSDAETGIIRQITRNREAASSSILEEMDIGHDAIAGSLHRLENLGFIRQNEQQRFVLANHFFRRWMREVQDKPTPGRAVPEPVPEIIRKRRRPGKDAPPSLGSFFAELKRRRVMRVGIAYIAIAWVLLQVAEILFEFLEVPSWAGKLMIVILGIGLPVALFLAWAFQLTPEGIMRDEEMQPGREAGRQPGGGQGGMSDPREVPVDEPRPLPAPLEPSREVGEPADVRGRSVIAELERLMVEEKVYREEDFTLRRLARKLNMKEYRLRRLINTHLGYRNFNQFLNEYRVAEVARLLVDPETRHLPVLTLALDMGYRSLSPFNKAFKEIKGMTPTEYRSHYGQVRPT
jgi:AraC-like DNA-binding protein